jgi:hypothetical protein
MGAQVGALSPTLRLAANPFEGIKAITSGIIRKVMEIMLKPQGFLRELRVVLPGI